MERKTKLNIYSYKYRFNSYVLLLNMDRIEKIKNIIYQWRQKFKTREKINYITSRRANRNFINMLKGSIALYLNNLVFLLNTLVI